MANALAPNHKADKYLHLDVIEAENAWISGNYDVVVTRSEGEDISQK